MSPDKKTSQEPMWPEVKAQMETLNGRLPERAHLERFRQQKWWFTHGQFENHGALHQYRVSKYLGVGLAEFAKNDIIFPQTIVDALFWSGVTHDTQIKRGRYLAHGQDAAKWVGENLKGKMDKETLRLTQFYCANHALLDRYLVGQDYVNGQDPVLVDTGLKLLKDADAVDRVRFPRFHPAHIDESFLRLPVTKRILLPTAKELFARTGERQMDCDAAFDLVMEQSIDMGIVK